MGWADPDTPWADQNVVGLEIFADIARSYRLRQGRGVVGDLVAGLGVALLDLARIVLPDV